MRLASVFSKDEFDQLKQSINDTGEFILRLSLDSLNLLADDNLNY